MGWVKKRGKTAHLDAGSVHIQCAGQAVRRGALLLPLQDAGLGRGLTGQRGVVPGGAKGASVLAVDEEAVAGGVGGQGGEEAQLGAGPPVGGGEWAEHPVDTVRGGHDAGIGGGGWEMGDGHEESLLGGPSQSKPDICSGKKMRCPGDPVRGCHDTRTVQRRSIASHGSEKIQVWRKRNASPHTPKRSGVCGPRNAVRRDSNHVLCHSHEKSLLSCPSDIPPRCHSRRGDQCPRNAICR